MFFRKRRTIAVEGCRKNVRVPQARGGGLHRAGLGPGLPEDLGRQGGRGDRGRQSQHQHLQDIQLQQVALDSAMQLEGESVREEDRVVPLLDRLLRRRDAMLAIVDLLVFNRANVRNVLLTAYRHRVPVFGVSESYAKAGCVAAVYSTPGHIGVQLAEEILAYATDGDAGLPTPQFPRYFSVAYNSRVARSLDLYLEKLEGFGKQPETSSGVEQ